jgi:pyruvate dehydrogenase E2 component (dihydrolipoamide acetyltransferase)
MSDDFMKSKAYKVVIPQLGLTMQEATITEWLHTDGAWVEKGEPLFLLENEKSVVEVEAPASGHLRIQTEPGVTVPVLHPVGVIEGADRVADHHIAEDTQDEINQKDRRPKTGHRKPAFHFPSSDQIAASPRARRAAFERGVDLSKVQGSGIRGMITTRDLEEHATRQERSVLASPIARKIANAEQIDLNGLDGTGPRGMIMRQDVEAKILSGVDLSRGEILSGLTGLRAIIAERLSQSWQQSPHVTLTIEVDATQLVSMRKVVNANNAGDPERSKVSFTTILIKLTGQVLQKYPYMNTRLTARGIETLTDVNIGFAVDTERGLMVPVIHSADKKSMTEIQAILDELAARAREGRSLPDDLAGGTFSITNLGGYEIDAFTPIINPPECAVLGVGRIHPRPVGLHGEIVLRDMMILSLSFDHRLVDGAPAAKFLQTLKHVIENPLAADV